MIRLKTIAPAALLFGASCLASKSDIRLLQDELRATRAQVAVGDTSILVAGESQRQQIAQLAARLDRAIDSLRVVSNRLASFSANTNGNFDAMQQQVTQMQAMLSQTTRNLQDTRARVQVLSEGIAGAGAAPPAPVVPSDSSRAGAAPPASSAPSAGIPGAATLYQSATESINQGAYATGRRSLEQLLTSYPSNELAPRALLKVGDTYSAERNLDAADSVYRLVTQRYPKSSEAGTGLYRVGKALWDAGRKAEGRPLLERVIREYPNTDAASLAKETLNPRG